MAKLVINDEKTKGQFETLCAFHTPIEDIAIQLDVSIVELKQWIWGTYKQDSGRVYQRFMRTGNSILNKSALKLAEKSDRMNIWLRKQWLSERDPDKAIVDKSAQVVDVEERPDVFDEIAKRLAGGK